MQPNFFIVGTPKAGTTSLYYYLEEHPEVYMSAIKETNHFSFEDIIQQGLFYNNDDHVRTPADYAAQFAGVTTETAIGEASVSYLFYPSVPEKIKAFNPDARIIMILRNPVDRGFSHYLMDRRLGFVNMPLKDIVHKKGKSKSVELFYQQYIGLGLYHDQVKRYLDVFGKDKVKVFLYEDIVTNINEVVKEIYQFLGVDDLYQASTGQKHNTFLAPKNPLIEKLYTLRFFRGIVKALFNEKLQNAIKNSFFAKEKKPQLDPDLRKELQAIYKQDIIETGRLINKDLSKWLH